jgi:hypothetical protein
VFVCAPVVRLFDGRRECMPGLWHASLPSQPRARSSWHVNGITRPPTGHADACWRQTRVRGPVSQPKRPFHGAWPNGRRPTFPEFSSSRGVPLQPRRTPRPGAIRTFPHHLPDLPHAAPPRPLPRVPPLFRSFTSKLFYSSMRRSVASLPRS